MKQPSYREQDHDFGQMILSLRSAIGLTQTELAEVLGVSRRAISDWEAGDKYPKAEHLEHFIFLAFQHHAFHSGREETEIRTLWKTAHQKVLLDELWLSTVLADISVLSNQPVLEQTNIIPIAVALPTKKPRVDWGNALTVPTFYGREYELTTLSTWVVEEHCRIVGVLGLGGIGKSALSVTLMHQVAAHFDVVIWHSLRDSPACASLLDECLQVLSPQSFAQTPPDFEQRLNLLLTYMRNQRALVVLDNLETLLEEGETKGRMRPGYEDYEKLLRRVGETDHQSCFLFTSREKLVNLAALEGSRLPVRILRLSRLESKPCEELLAEKGAVGKDSEQTQLIDTYAGNPLALKIVAQTIVDLFDGEIALFLEQGEIIFGNIRQLLAEQFLRLSALEQTILFWLATLREPSSLNELLAVIIPPVSRSQLLEAINALHRRSLIERGQKQATFTLQSVVLEYITARLIEEVSDEIHAGQFAHLIEYGLELAQVDEYIRQTQDRLIVAPILMRLQSRYWRQSETEEQLLKLLAHLGTQTEDRQGYGPANLLVLLRQLRGHLRELDLSHLLIRNAYLQGVEMQDTRLVNTTIQNSPFTETFDAMTSVAISRTGEYWAAASIRGEMRIWAEGGHLLHQTWLGHSDAVWALAFSSDGLTLVSGSSDGMHKVWDVASGRLLWSVRHASFVNRVAFSPDGLQFATAGNDATVRLWDVSSGTLLETLPHPLPVSMVSWSPDGQFVATGDIEGFIRLWSITDTKMPPTLTAVMENKSYVDGMVFAPDGHTLASSGWDITVKLWSIPDGRLLHTLAGHTKRVARLDWSPDGRTIASSSADQTILLWDVEQARYRAVLRGHTGDVYQVAFTPDSLSLLSGSRDGTLRVWDVVTEQCVRVIQGYATSIYDVDWSPDGAQIASGASDMIVTIWDVAHKMPLRFLQKHTGVVSGVGWSSTGRWLASIETEHAIRLWDLTSNIDFQFLRNIDIGGNYTYSLSWSPDGYHLASGTHHGGVMIWNVTTLHQTWIGRQITSKFPHVTWSPDGTHLAGGGDDGIVYIWNITEDLVEQCLGGHHSYIKSIAWSPDGLLVASGSGSMQGGELFVWDVQSGERIHNFIGHSDIVLALAWDATGDRLISGGAEGVIRCWDVQSGEYLWIRQAHEGTVQSLKRSPDGTKIASCGDDGAIMLWDLNTGEHLQTLRRDRPYERLNITGIKGLTEAQKENLRALGATEDNPA